MRIGFLLTCLFASGCHDPHAAREDIEKWNDGFSESESSSTGSDDSAASGSASDAGDDGNTSTGDPEPPESTGDPEPEHVVVELNTNTETLLAAGSILVTAKVTGPIIERQFTVNGSPHPWDEGADEIEYIVDGSTTNHLLRFEMFVAGEGGSTDFASAEVSMALPEPGSVRQRVVDATPNSSGNALAIVPGEPGELDTVWAVGNAGEFLRFSRLDGDGDLWTTTVPDPMHVESVAVDDEGSLFVAGGLAGSLKVRRYRNLGGKWVSIWERAIEGAVAHDIEVGPDGRVYVVGELTEEAAIWVLTESGGTVSHDTYSALANGIPLISSARAVAAFENGVVVVGDLQTDNEDQPLRAALFTFDGELLELGAHDLASDPEVTSQWTAVVPTPDGLMGVGWVKTVGQAALARGLFSSDLTSAAVSLTSGSVGEDIAWHGPGGVEVVVGSQTGALFASGGTVDYLDAAGMGTSVVVDRHGYTHVTGRVVVDGAARLVLVTLNP